MAHEIHRVSYGDGNGRFVTTLVCEDGCPLGVLSSYAGVIDSIQVKVQDLHRREPGRSWMAIRAIAGWEKRRQAGELAFQTFARFWQRTWDMS